MVLVGHLLATAGLAFIALTFVFLFGRKADRVEDLEKQIEMLDGVVDEQSTSIVELQNRVQQLNDENAWLSTLNQEKLGRLDSLRGDNRRQAETIRSHEAWMKQAYVQLEQGAILLAVAKHCLEQYIGFANVLNDEREFLCGDLADAYEALGREERENRQAEHAMGNAIDRLQERVRAHEIARVPDTRDCGPLIPQTIHVTIGG